MNREGGSRSVWPDQRGIRDGWFHRLRLAAGGLAAHELGIEVRATGVLNVVYAELLLKLSKTRVVRAFAYDWRKDMRTVAMELDAFLRGQFGDAPVDLVAPGSGAAVARTMLAMWTESGRIGTTPTRLVSLGEPTQGTFVALRILLGLDPTVERIARWTSNALSGQPLETEKIEVAKTFASFPAVYHLRPRSSSPKRPDFSAALDQAEAYSHFPVVVAQDQLDQASKFRDWLDVID